MITAERIRELIKNNKSIYIASSDNGINVPRIDKYDALDLATLMLSSHSKQLYETKADWEFDRDFGNITSVRTLSIPSYEKVKRMIEPSEEYSFWFETADGWKNELIVVWNEYTEKFEVCVVGNCGAYEFKEDFTKENYIKACEVVKERFLEGSDETYND